MNDWLLLKINGWAGHNHLLDTVMLLCARDLIYLVFAVLVAWFALAAYRRQFQPASVVAINLVLAFVLLLIASHVFREQRPFVTHHLTQLMPHKANQSFPSDHTTAASAIAFGFMLFTRWRKTGGVLLLVAILIGFARVFAGVHYPGDIVGGVVIAATAAALVWAAQCTWLARHKPPRDKLTRPD